MRLPPSPPAWSLQSKAPCRVCGPVESEVHWSSPRPSLETPMRKGGASDPEETCGHEKTLKHHFLEHGISKTKVWKLWTTKKWKTLKDTTVIYSPIMRPHIPFQSFVCYFFFQHKSALELAYSSNLRPSNLHRGVFFGDQASCANQNWRQHKHLPPNTRELNDPLLVKLLQKRKHSSVLHLGVTKVRHWCSPGNPPLHLKLSYNKRQIRMPIKFSSPMRVKIMMMSYVRHNLEWDAWNQQNKTFCRFIWVSHRRDTSSMMSFLWFSCMLGSPR